MKPMVVMVVGMMILAGCGVRAPVQPRQDPYVPDQIHLTHSDIRRNTAFREPVSHYDENGILYVQVPVRSTTNQQMHIDYRVTFFDGNGRQIYQSGWMTKVLAPNVPDNITFNSLRPGAADFQVDMRFAR
jgi:uncharacterized protein YcfL